MSICSSLSSCSETLRTTGAEDYGRFTEIYDKIKIFMRV